MNTLQRLCLATAAGLILTGTVAGAETHTWLTFKPQGAGDAQARTTQWLVDEFEKRTDGAHKIEVFWGGSVAGTGEIPDALANGVGDFGDIATPYFSDAMPLNNAVGFFIPQPMGTLEVGNAMEAWHAEYPQFSEELERQNLHAFGFRPLEDYGLLCKEPINSLDDLEGRRIRSYGFAYPALIEAMGATPVSITTADTYEALERSIVDCTPIGPALARGWKYDEVAKYYIDMPLGASFGHLLAMNLDTYNGMDDDTRAVVDQLGKDYLQRYARVLKEDAARVLELWQGDLGVEVIDFPAEDLVALAEDPGVQAVREEWIGMAKKEGLPVDEIVKDLQF